jgi:hypothetical protein
MDRHLWWPALWHGLDSHLTDDRAHTLIMCTALVAINTCCWKQSQHMPPWQLLSALATGSGDPRTLRVCLAAATVQR